MCLRKCSAPLLLFLSIHILETNSGERRECGPLKTFKNVEVRCLRRADGGESASSACGSGLRSGSVVEYKCRAFHVPFEEEAKGNPWQAVVCGEDGRWRGLQGYEAFRCKEDCGRLSGNAKALVVSGVASNSTLWPWHAALFRRHGEAWEYICGGTLVRSQVLLTAAHCLSLHRDTSPPPNHFRVVLAAVSTTYELNLKSTTAQLHSVGKIYMSAHYDPAKGLQADIAVLHLQEEVAFSEDVLPVCLPNDYSTDLSAIKAGSRGKVGGFGLNDVGTLAESLRSVEIGVRSTSECFASLRRVLSESQFCAGQNTGEKWETLCNGDSGGGMCFLSNVHQKYHIHGITSSGDAEKRKGICQNYAVFTRIYSFIFWIRDVVEEIFGEMARDLHENVPYLFDFRGTERDAVVFRGLPREWENRITSFSLSFAEVETSKVLDALEFAKTLVTFNLSHVLLGGAFSRRVLLPHLATFYVDALNAAWVVDEKRRLPPEVTEASFQAFLFFDKDFGHLRSWALPSLLSLRTDVQLILAIFRVIHVNHAKGELFMNDLSFCGKILAGIALPTSEFVLRHLALRRCGLNSFDSLTLSAVFSLTLEEVAMETDHFLPILKRAPKLKILRLNPLSEATISLTLSHFPESLTFLALGKKVRLSLKASSGNGTLPHLSYLFCDLCTDAEELLRRLPTVFPKLRGLMLRSGGDVRLPSFAFKRNTFLYFEKKGEAWVRRALTAPKLKEALHASSGGTYFWTSQLEFNARMRLTSFEKGAMASHHYAFRGKAKGELFGGIPTPVQERLVSISLDSVQISPLVLRDSVSSAPLLKSLTLTNAHFHRPLPDVRFQFHSLQLQNTSIDYMEEVVDGTVESIVIPLQNGCHGNRTHFANVLHRTLEDFNSLQLWRNTSTLFLLNAVVGEAIPAVRCICEGVGVALQNGALDLSHFHVQHFAAICELFLQFGEVLPPEFELPGLLPLDAFFLEELRKYPFVVNVFRNKVFRVPFRSWVAALNPSFSKVRGRKWLQIATLPYAHTFALSLLNNSLSTLIY